MEELERLTKDYHGITSRIDLRGTAEQAAIQGFILIAMKEQCVINQIDWYAHLEKEGIATNDAEIRKVQRQMQTAKLWQLTSPSVREQKMSREAFIRFMKKANKAAQAAEDTADMIEAMERADELPEDEAYQIHEADNTTFAWPKPIDLIVGDPIWDKMAQYKWLGGFAQSHLKDTGLLLVQCGQGQLPDVLDILRAAGLNYRWTMGINYDWALLNRMVTIAHPFMLSLRLVLVFTKGEFDRDRIKKPFSDSQSVTEERKTWHPLGQPQGPWDYWLSKLTMPGEQICDPFSGGGTTAEAIKKLGQRRRFIGTEVNPEYAKASQGDLRATVEGSYWTQAEEVKAPAPEPIPDIQAHMPPDDFWDRYPGGLASVGSSAEEVATKKAAKQEAKKPKKQKAPEPEPPPVVLPEGAVLGPMEDWHEPPPVVLPEGAVLGPMEDWPEPEPEPEPDDDETAA